MRLKTWPSTGLDQGGPEILLGRYLEILLTRINFSKGRYLANEIFWKMWSLPWLKNSILQGTFFVKFLARSGPASAGHAFRNLIIFNFICIFIFKFLTNVIKTFFENILFCNYCWFTYWTIWIKRNPFFNKFKMKYIASI